MLKFYLRIVLKNQSTTENFLKIAQGALIPPKPRWYEIHQRNPSPVSV